jgi:ubiquinone/menaquinone biosynthesis C-methylase UbiE
MATSDLSLDAINRFLADLEAAKDDDELRAKFKSYSAPYDLNVPADPFGAEYRAKQLGLYESLAGKRYTPDNERTLIDIEESAVRPFPYCHGSSETVGNQLMAIGFLIKTMGLPKGARILEFGPGWGNTTIALAKMGYRVTAVDIEENFVNLISARAKRESLTIELVRGDFSYIFSTKDKYDAILFFECFHHAQDHLALIQGFDRVLNPQGIACFAAEPIVDDFPIPWGLRMDGESLWAIRKHGWLELGFNKAYFTAALERFGWAAMEYVGHDGPWSKVTLAKRPNEIRYEFRFSNGGLRSGVGILEDGAVVVRPKDEGYVAFGPYARLPPGKWVAVVLLQPGFAASGSFFVDVVDEFGSVRIAPEMNFEIAPGAGASMRISFSNATALNVFEVRVRCLAGSEARIQGIDLAWAISAR